VSTYGKIYLVGAGPGDPDLITIRGQELLQWADVVLYDSLSHKALLNHCHERAELRDVGKRGGARSPSQDWITAQLIELSKEGKHVVRLKGGDSFLFARGAEEAEALVAAGVPFEVVPGLSSPVGTSAYAGIPLTHRDLSSSVTFITGSDKAGEQWSGDAWRKLATATDTICVLMGMRNIREITRAVVAGGRSEATPAAVVQWGARPEQRVVTSTLANIAEDAIAAGLSNPAVIIIGEVVKLRETLRWYDRMPLFGKRVLVPRAQHQARATAQAIRQRAAEPILFPVITVREPPEPERVTAAIEALSSYDWVLFTSANGVERFFTQLQKRGLDARALGSCSVGVIGPKTSEALAQNGINADLVAEEYVGEALASAVLERGAGARVLIPRALVAREELPQRLRALGVVVDVVPIYQTVGIGECAANELSRLLRAGEVDVAIFTSSSTAVNTCGALGTDAASVLSTVTVASIGPVTSKTLTSLGVRVDVQARVYTIAGLLDALEEHQTKANT
jgi:uroporphyrinogen III methyltransferase/synthase